MTNRRNNKSFKITRSRAAAARTAAIACAAIFGVSPVAIGQVFDTHDPSLTTYKPLAKTNVQDVRPRPEQRGVLIDGTLVSPSLFGWAISADPWFQNRWNEKVETLDGIRPDTATYQINDVDIALPAPGFSWVIGRSYNHRQLDSDDAAFTSVGYQGKNWFQTSQPEIVIHDEAGTSNDMVYLVYGADRYVEFRRVTGESNVTYRATNGAAGAVDFLADSEGPDLYKFIDGRGTQVWFFAFGDDVYIPAAKAGQIWKIKDTDGDVAYVGHETNPSTALTDGFNSSGQIIKAYDSATGLGRRRYLYTYSSGYLDKVQAQTKSGGNWSSPTGVVDIAKVEYFYHDGLDATGSAGDLKRVKVTIVTADGALDHESEKYYRYYKGTYHTTTNPGHANEIKMALGYEGARNYDWDEGGTSPEPIFNQSYESASVTDTTLKPYSEAFFEYTDTDSLINKAIFNGECGCTGGINGEYTFLQETNPGYFNNTGYDTEWARRTTVTSPLDVDSKYIDMTYYYDEVGQPLSLAVVEWTSGGTPTEGETWAVYVVRDADGFIDTIHSPKNVISYSPYSGGNPDGSFTLSTSAGLLFKADRVASGNMKHFIEHYKVADGFPVSPTYYLDATLEYTSATKTVGDATIVRPFVESHWVYFDEGIADVLTGSPTNVHETQVAYTFWTGDAALMPKQLTITRPAVSTSKNGSGTANSEKRYYREDGTLAFAEAADGVFTYYSLDSEGLLDRNIDDAKTNHATAYDSGDDPNTKWSIVEGPGGLHEVTDFSYDFVGRATTTTRDPGGSNEHKSRLFTTYLKDRRIVTLSIPHFTTGGGTTYFGPAVYDVSNHGGQVEFSGVIGVDSSGETTALVDWIDETNGDDPLTSLDTMAVAAVVRMSTSTYAEAGRQLDEERTYHSIPSSGVGSEGTNYERVAYGYDNRGRRNRVVTPKGTIYNMKFDQRGNVATEVSMGTDDGAGDGSNMKQHRALIPDKNSGFPKTKSPRPTLWAGGGNGGAGGGYSMDGENWAIDPETGECIMWVHDSHSTITYTRDYRGGVIARKNPVSPHLLIKRDNQSQIVAIGFYSATASGWESQDPTTHAADRIGLEEYNYDELGRLWKVTRWRIDRVDGSKDASLDSQYWYDKVDQAVKIDGPQLQKALFDGLRRERRRYALASDNDTSYAHTLNVDGDIVLKEHFWAFEPGTDDVVLQGVVSRYHDDDAAGTKGELDTNADNDDLKITASNLKGRIQFVALWFDDLGRIEDEVAYGTNKFNETGGPSSFDRDGLSVPARSGDKLRESYSYDEAGELLEATDPRNKKTRYEYDDARRKTAIILNYTAAATPITNLTRDYDLYTRFEYGTYEPDDPGSSSTDPWVDETWVDMDGDGTFDSGDGDQKTSYTYGVDGAATPVSYFSAGHLVYEIKYPDSGSSSDVLKKGYNEAEKVQTILDQEGNEIVFEYDVGARETRREVWTWGGGTGLSKWIDYIDLSYNSLGRLELITQWDIPTSGPDVVVNEVKLHYDDWGNIEKIEQDHNSAIGASGSVDDFEVSHTYASASGGRNTLRRSSTTYPGSNTIDFVYTGTGNSLDDDASRVSKIDFSAVTLATYEYLGVQQVVGVDYPEADVFRHHYGSTQGDYPDFDRFNRVINDRWTKDLSTDKDFFDADVSYDENSSPTLIDDHVHSTIWDFEYSIDGVDRVEQAERGDWGGSSFNSTSQDELWDYTLTGGWDLHKLDIDGDGSFTNYAGGDLQDAGTLNAVNELTGRDTDNNGSDNYTLVYDAMGNLTDDNENYKYVYDIFGRLKTVNDQSDNLVAEYEYDGLGRMTRLHADLDGNATIASTEWLDFVYDERWRLVTVHDNGVSEPMELFVHHDAGLDGRGGGSYIDGLVSRMRDTDTGTEGFEERVYYCQNWRADVVAIVTDTGTQVEMARYSAYGVPDGLPYADADSDGDCDIFDLLAIQNWIVANAYDIRGDTDLDGDVDVTDLTNASNATGVTLGRGVQSSIDSRFGYGGYQWDRFVAMNHVRYRVYKSDLGRWLNRDPIGYEGGTMNVYEYAGANPVSWLDPSGLQFLPGTNLPDPGFWVPIIRDIIKRPPTPPPGTNPWATPWPYASGAAGAYDGFLCWCEGMAETVPELITFGIWSPTIRFPDPWKFDPDDPNLKTSRGMGQVSACCIALAVARKATLRPRAPGNPAKGPVIPPRGFRPTQPRGNLFNRRTGESLSPDFCHPPPKIPGWDYHRRGFPKLPIHLLPGQRLPPIRWWQRGILDLLKMVF